MKTFGRKFQKCLSGTNGCTRCFEPPTVTSVSFFFFFFSIRILRNKSTQKSVTQKSPSPTLEEGWRVKRDWYGQKSAAFVLFKCSALLLNRSLYYSPMCPSLSRDLCVSGKSTACPSRNQETVKVWPSASALTLLLSFKCPASSRVPVSSTFATLAIFSHVKVGINGLLQPLTDKRLFHTFLLRPKDHGTGNKATVQMSI